MCVVYKLSSILLCYVLSLYTLTFVIVIKLLDMMCFTVLDPLEHNQFCGRPQITHWRHYTFTRNPLETLCWFLI